METVGREAAAGGEPVKSADRSLALLEFLAARPGGATFAEIIGALGLPRSSGHALLQTLLVRCYVEVARPAGRERRYRLGLKLAELSAGYYRGRSLLEQARAAVGELAARSGETAHLAVLDGTDVLYLAADEGEQAMRLISPLGRRVPAHATATGKALLAGLSDDEVRRRYGAPGQTDVALPQLTWRTASSLHALLRELDEVRRLGHAHDVEGFVEGVHCVAAPVTGAGGQPEAALSVSIPTPRLAPSRLPELARLVCEVAGRISAAHSVALLNGEEAPRSWWRPGAVRVGWSMGQMLLPSFGEMYRVVHELAPTLGADVIWTDAYDDERKQTCDVMQLLALQPDVLVVHPVHTIQADELFRAAASAGVPAICYRRPARSDAFALFAGSDTFREGELQIECVASRLPAGGTVAIIEGDPYNDNARNIAEGNRAALARHPRLRLVADEVSPGWSRTTARRLAGQLLDRHGAALDAIVCANDHMAGAVAEVLAARGLAGRIILVGGDGERAAVELLRTGTLHATVFHDPGALASETLRAAVALAQRRLDLAALPRRRPAVNPPSRSVPVIDVPVELVTHETIDRLVSYWQRVDAAAVPASSVLYPAR